MADCTSIQQRVKITLLRETAVWWHCTEPSLFEHICSFSDFQNKCPSSCIDVRLFVPSAPQAHKDALSLSFTIALSQSTLPSVAGSSKHYRQECASPFPVSSLTCTAQGDVTVCQASCQQQPVPKSAHSWGQRSLPWLCHPQWKVYTTVWARVSCK